MIDDELKEKLIKEIEKNGNVYLSCRRTNVDKSTYYRWIKENKDFSKRAKVAEKLGRENNCDLAEHALMINVKDQKMDAIKYVLSHNSPIYKKGDNKKASSVVIVHRKEDQSVQEPKETFEDVVKRDEKKTMDDCLSVYTWLITYYNKIPNKLNGEPIPLEEFSIHQEYMRDWCFLNDVQKQQTGITWRHIKRCDIDNPSFKEIKESVDGDIDDSLEE